MRELAIFSCTCRRPSLASPAARWWTRSSDAVRHPAPRNVGSAGRRVESCWVSAISPRSRRWVRPL